MPLTIEELRTKVVEYLDKGLSSQQIADELSLSHSTIQWLISGTRYRNIVPTPVRSRSSVSSDDEKKCRKCGLQEEYHRFSGLCYYCGGQYSNDSSGE